MGRIARKAGGDRRRESAEPRLPIGAEAALCAILDVSPTLPRSAPQPTVEPTDERSVVDLRELEVGVDAVDPYYDLGAIAENAPLTNHLFTTAPD